MDSKKILGKKAPNIELPATKNKTINLSHFKGFNVVVYFYPKDATPGCTQEGKDFTKLHRQFSKLNTKIFGVSKDSLKSHNLFKNKQKYTFDLISDEEQKLCKYFDVIKEKTNYGKKYKDIERSTFIIDLKGKIIKEWRKVKVLGHVKAVLDVIKNLQC